RRQRRSDRRYKGTRATGEGSDRSNAALGRHCEELLRRSNPSIRYAAIWIASRSLSSGAHSRDPLARNDETSPPHHVRPTLFQRARIGRSGMDALEERHRLRVPLLQSAAGGGGFERKTHLNVGAGKFVAGEPFALAEFAFPIIH